MVTELQNLLPNLIHPILQMETDKVICTADPMDRGRLEDQPGCPIGIIRCGNDTGGGVHVPEVVAKLCLTQNQAIYIHLQSPADHVGLVAAQDDGIGRVEQQIFSALGQSDGHFTGHRIGVFTGFVQDLAFQHGKQIEKGYGFQYTGIYQTHVIAGHIFPGEHTVQSAVLVSYGHCRNVLLRLQMFPSPTYRDGSAEHGRRIKVQITNLGVHAADALRWFKAEAV